MNALVLAAAVLLGCSSHSGTSPPMVTPDAEAMTSCESDFDLAIVKTCAVAADCVLLAHEGCCGDLELGIAASDLAAAQTAEAHFDACIAASCGGRGCASETVSEDGKVPTGSQQFVADCVASRCIGTVQ